MRQGYEQTDPILISIKYLSACLKHRHLSWPIPNPREKKRKAAKSPSYWCIRNMHEQFNAFFFTFFLFNVFLEMKQTNFIIGFFFYLLIIWSSCHLWNFPQGHLSSIYTGRILQLSQLLLRVLFSWPRLELLFHKQRQKWKLYTDLLDYTRLWRVLLLNS